MELPIVIVKRSQWGRGQGSGYLCLASTGLQCCLGFVCRAAGLPENVITGKMDVHQVITQLPAPALLNQLVEPVEYGVAHSTMPTQLHNDMTSTNDREDYTDTEREAQLIRLGRQAGFELVFEG